MVEDREVSQGMNDWECSVKCVYGLAILQIIGAGGPETHLIEPSRKGFLSLFVLLE